MAFTTKAVLQIHLLETNTLTITIVISPVIKVELVLIHLIQLTRRKTKEPLTEEELQYEIRIKLHGLATIRWLKVR